MKVVQTHLAEENQTDYFIMPTWIPNENIHNYISKIKNHNRVNWKRMPREIVSITPFNESTFPVPEMKYITVRSDETLRESIFIFSKTVDHDCMHEIINVLCDEHDDGEFQWVIGAGFTDFKITFGRSETLLKNSRLEDIEIYNESK